MRIPPSTDNSVRRFPRTLAEAFGPHTSQCVEPKPLTPEEKIAKGNRELVAVSILIALVGVAGLFLVFSTAGAK